MILNTKYTKGTKLHKVLFLLLCVALCLSVLVLNSPASAHAPRITHHASLITSGNDWSSFPSISADGRFVVFASNADNLIDGDTNFAADIFVYDAQTGITQRVSVSSEGEPSNAISTRPAISANGRFVAFESLANNLVPGDTNYLSDIFVHDRLMGTTERVSVSVRSAEGNGWSEQASISGDGRFVAFISAADNLFPGDTNGVKDAFLYDRLNGYIQRVSLNSEGEQANGETTAAWVTPADRTVVFVSEADNLVAGDTNGVSDIFAYNRLLFRTVKIPGTNEAGTISTSTGGQWIGYLSPARGPFGTGNIYDQLNESTTAGEFPGALAQQVISPDGQQIIGVVALQNGTFDLYAHDLESGETALLAEEVSEARPAVSVDGGVIAYAKPINGISQIMLLDRRAQPEAAYTLSGRVTGPLGDPLAMVTIKAGPEVEAITDGQGYFQLGGVTPGSVTLLPEKTGFHFEPASISIEARSDQTELNFQYAHNEVITEARKDIGMPYDHRCDSGPECEGPFHGYAAGQCTDLVLDAFEWGADYRIKLALENDAKAHPEHFYQNTNARDAFDMWRYFMYSEQMLPDSAPYQVGDMVFFDWSGDGEIDHVALVSAVDGANMPTMLVDATGVIASNPSGLAAELPWEPFHERSLRGHARWNGAYEAFVFGMPAIDRLQIGLGSVGAAVKLGDWAGRGISGMQNSLPGATFFDFGWEQNLTVANPLEGGGISGGNGRYYVVISNPTDVEMPYYFVIQMIQEGRISEVVKIIDTLPPGQVRYLPFELVWKGDAIGFEFLPTGTRQMRGEIRW